MQGSVAGEKWRMPKLCEALGEEQTGEVPGIKYINIKIIYGKQVG